MTKKQFNSTISTSSPFKDDSYLYSGTIRHRRNSPRIHKFTYPIFMTLIDIDNVDRIFRFPLLFSAKWPSLIQFRRSDFYGDKEVSLTSSIRHLLRDELGIESSGPIRLLTHLRYFGFSFNPVSFYYCFSADDKSIVAVIAEVSNTPWDERHCYVIPWDEFCNTRELFYECEKEFHVSPFMELNQCYRWRISDPENDLRVRIECHQDSQLIFEAELSLRRRKLSTLNLVRTLIRFPIIPLQVVAAIYWQAFLLWCKNVPFVPHPKVKDETAVEPSQTS